MTDQTNDQGPTELEMLKQRAALMGIKHSNNIKPETLRAMIAAKLAGEEQGESQEANGTETNALEAGAQFAAAKDSIVPGSAPAAAVGNIEAPAKPKSARQQMIEEQMRLVRVRITNLDPKKKDLHGEIFTVANEVLGTVRKFIPYGESTDDGYHVPYILFQQLESRRFLNIRTTKDKKTGTPRVESNWVKEFALEVLPPLTEDELKRLATAQIAAGTVGNNAD